MPILIYSGSPGGGKSYWAISDIRKNVDDGVEVWTNIDGLKVDQFSNPDLIHLMTPEEVQRPWNFLPDNCVCIIDEALMPFPVEFGNDEKTCKQDIRDLRLWATQHRHKGQNIILIVQNVYLLSKIIRGCADSRLDFHNQGHLGFARRVRINYHSPCMIRRPFITERHIYDLSVFKLYDSVKPGSILASKKGKNILFSPFLVVPLLLLCVASYFLFGIFDRKKVPISPSVPVSQHSDAFVSTVGNVASVVTQAGSGDSSDSVVSPLFFGGFATYSSNGLPLLSLNVGSSFYTVLNLPGHPFHVQGRFLFHRSDRVLLNSVFTDSMFRDLLSDAI